MVEYLGEEDLEIYTDEEFSEFLHSDQTINLYHYEEDQIIGEEELGDFFFEAKHT